MARIAQSVQANEKTFVDLQLSFYYPKTTLFKYMDLLIHSTQSVCSTAVLRVNDPLIGWQTRPVNDLIMIRGDNGYSWLYWRDGSRHISAYPVKHYESKLTQNQYIRVHQNSIVNRDFIHKVHLTHRGPQISLTTGEKLSVSRRRWLFVKRNLGYFF